MATAQPSYDARLRSDERSGGILDRVVAFWASLKLTVVLFAISLLLVLVGTLAQDEENMLEVKQQYFNSLIAYVPLDVFVPQPFYPHDQPLASFELSDGRLLRLGFPMPGGALLGILLMANLVAAKVKRFRVSAAGGRLKAGLGLTAIGLLLTTLVIIGGNSSEGLQGDAPFSYDLLWQITCWSMGLAAIAAMVTAFYQPNTLRRVIVGCLAGGLVVSAAILFAWTERPSDSSLRILWQLMESGLAGLPLLAGFMLVFGTRGGNALVHYGIALLMLGQFIFGDRQLEQRLTLVEGQATNVLRNADAVELAVIDRSDPDEDKVISVPSAALARAENNDQPITDARLPFEITVLDYYPNSTLKPADEAPEGRVTEGFGKQYVALPRAPFGGADPGTNLASAYVQLRDKESGESLGTYLVSQFFSDWELLARRSGATDDYDSVTVDGKTYDIGLRFRRVAKPYWVRLEDVRRQNYSGTMTPRDYSSFVYIVDQETGESRRERIWMNNPLRYRGETFYQSEYQTLLDGNEQTVLQVVENAGWKIPYVCCVLVGMGLIVHFSGTLKRFLNRMDRDPTQQAQESTSLLLPGIAAAICGLLFVGALTPRPLIASPKGEASSPSGMDFYRAGEIPVQFGGRIMPLDAYARQTLQAISNKTKLYLTEAQADELGKRVDGETMPAIQWLFEVATQSELVEDYELIRIDASEVLNELELVRRRSNRYPLSAIRQKVARLDEAVSAARKVQEEDESQLSFKQAKLIELDNRVRAYTLLAASFERLEIPPIPTPESLRENPEQAAQQFAVLRGMSNRMEALQEMNAPAVLPDVRDMQTENVVAERWMTYAAARFDAALSEVIGEGAPPPTLETFDNIVVAYRDGNAEAFNLAVRKHNAAVEGTQSPMLASAAVKTERWLEAKNPLTVARIAYILCGLLTLIGFAVAPRKIRPIVFGVLVATLVIHTLSLAARIYVTGRPPVINLYSSAIFIGWSAVIAGLVFEMLYRTGLGNLVASVSGGATLMVAYGLDAGDTMPVLQAVLDTQFWLGTHVITVALGYTATFVAGLLGLIWIVMRLMTSESDPKAKRGLYDVYRMMYGTVCFAILFSFVGTVLGGLWADDSWGRFWGWDPKENGALMIVIWNALMLHARWDRWVGQRGFALLAMGGNLVTAWSWFGTNQLGLGLHAYGGNSGAQIALAAFAIGQLLVIAGGYVLTRPTEEIESRAA